MSLHFWWRSPRRSDSSTPSKTAASSAIAGVSTPPFVARLDRKASRYSLLETIAACSVVAGIVCEDWDDFSKFIFQPDWAVGRVAIGGAVVALGIVLEIWFSSRSSSAERKIRDWYALRVAELNLQTEKERTARLRLERRSGPLRPTAEFGEMLRGKPVGRIEIWHPPKREIWEFALRISTFLKDAGWTVVAVKAIPPPDQRYGLSFDVGKLGDALYTLITPRGAIPNIARGEKTAADVLVQALAWGVAGIFMENTSYSAAEQNLSDPNLFILVLGES
jgi:hypothetical protein